jgi:hypothetical protein
MTTVIFIFAIAFALSCIPPIFVYLASRRRESGDRLITCPETRSAAVVRVDAGHAAVTDLQGEKNLRLEACSRWPEKADCGQDCLRQIECAPDGCLVRERLATWYHDARCALCGLVIGPFHWYEYRPGLLTPERRVKSWTDIRPEDLPENLAADRPICSDCFLAESFREEFPDRVLDDPWHAVDRKKIRASGPPA